MILAVFLVLFPFAAQASDKIEENNDAQLAVPERELRLPELPDMKPISSLNIPSTEQQNASYLNKQLNLSSEIKESSDPSEKLVGDFKIRFAPLPNREVLAIPDVRVSKPTVASRRMTYAEKRAKAKQDKLKEKQLKALAEMRKRELEALESDRKTLAALRDALKDLGLQKKLSFLAKGKTERGIDSEIGGTAAGAKAE